MNVLSLFDGMSCGQIALKKIGMKVNKYFACEIKPHAIKVTKANFPNTIQLGDVTKVSAKDLPKIDLLIGGSPCQDFSTANKVRLGLKGAKSSLFFEYLRLVQETKPKYFFLENVAMDKKSSDKISKLLGVQPVVINSKEVSGALRKRAYWTNIPFNGIKAKKKSPKLKKLLTHGYTEREKARCVLEGDSRPLSNPVRMINRYFNTGFTTLIFKDKNHYLACQAYAHAMKGRPCSDIADGKIPDVIKGVRYMNQIEMERVQTVPEGYTSKLSRDDSASLLGDGWTVDVIAQFFKGIK
jgi:site-specific DNA-cytosine methylase